MYLIDLEFLLNQAEKINKPPIVLFAFTALYMDTQWIVTIWRYISITGDQILPEVSELYTNPIIALNSFLKYVAVFSRF